jgi:hypothetical protein
MAPGPELALLADRPEAFAGKEEKRRGDPRILKS